MGKVLDLKGQVFGRLTVVEKADRNKSGEIQWLCKCECREFTYASTQHLRRGYKRSCGCLRKDVIAKRSKIHSKSKTPEYKAWSSMKGRCHNENDKSYENYGGRGIAVCNEWINNFEQFLDDMGLRPSKKHSLDRINVNGNYEPSNCRWATTTEQSRNIRCKKRSKTGIKGVYPYKDRRRFDASIGVCGKEIRLGVFDTLEEAAEARKQAEDKYWGEQI